jgi:GT2 family glycosyltransferase
MIYSREVLCTEKEYIHLDRVKFSDHGPARNTLVNRMLGDWILFIDTDHQPEPDLLARMLDRMNTHDIDVLTGLYRFKQPPCSPVVYVRDPSNTLLPVAKFPDSIFKIHAAGAGCLLIKKKVILQIQMEGEEPFDRMPGLSEDHSFFRRLEKLGINSYCDPRIECHHLRVLPVTESEDDDYMIGEQFRIEGKNFG